MDLHKLVYNYSTKYEKGFINPEIEDILTNFPDINMERFNDALMGITCTSIDGTLVIYHCDILTALRCGTENRDINFNEFD